MIRYRHTQVGYFIIVALSSGLFFGGVWLAVAGFSWICFGVVFVLAVCLALFPTLTVVIEDDVLEVRFGPGVVRKRFALKDVVSCRVVKNPWYYGWGVRLTPHGWLYNVSGFQAVEIQTGSGRRYRLGTDEPAVLERALAEALEKNRRV